MTFLVYEHEQTQVLPRVLSPSPVPDDSFCDRVESGPVEQVSDPVRYVADWVSKFGPLFSQTSSRDERVLVDRLEDGYEVLQPFLVTIREIAVGNYEACFDEANIAVNGTDAQDAYQALIAEILDTFDTLRDEPELSGKSREQLEILRSYIGT